MDNSTVKNNLPENVLRILKADLGADLNLAVCHDFGLTGDKIRGLTLLLRQIFHKELALNDLVSVIKDKFGFDEDKAGKMAQRIAGERLLPANDWFGGQIKEKISLWGGNPDDYAGIADKYDQALAEEEAQLVEKEDEKEGESTVSEEKTSIEIEKKPIDQDQEKKDSIKNFVEHFIDILDLDADYLEEYNDLLLLLLADDPGFGQKLEEALYKNEQNIGSEKIKIKDKMYSQTVSAWLKDFISVNSSENFDTLQISKYLTTAPNIKQLGAVEKNKLKKLLETYRIVKFFPESLQNIPESEWGVIPISRDAGSGAAKDKVGLPLTKGEKEVEEMRREAGGFAEGSIERLAIEEEIEKKRHIEDLKAERNKYKEGSLEWSALSTEINHLEAE